MALSHLKYYLNALTIVNCSFSDILNLNTVDVLRDNLYENNYNHRLLAWIDHEMMYNLNGNYFVIVVGFRKCDQVDFENDQQTEIVLIPVENLYHLKIFKMYNEIILCKIKCLYHLKMY